MNEKVIATKITQGVKTVKVTYNCEHCGRILVDAALAEEEKVKMEKLFS